LLLVGLVAVSREQEAQDGWPGLLREHLARHPQARAQDLYKLLYQGVMGAEHAVADAEAVERGLAREMDAVELDGAEPLTEPCNPEGTLVRVNLRPYKAQGGSASELAQAFIRTAQEARPEPERLAELLGQLGSADLGNARVQAELRSLRLLLAQRGYPPMSHSDAYRETYRPAYRLVLARLLPELGLAVGGAEPAPPP
jgi:hypothetical protein